MAKEQRLIDANKLDLYPNSDGIANNIWCGGKSGGKTMAAVLFLLRKMIENAPTVDAVEVVHAQWDHSHAGFYYCSACGKREAYPVHFNYCPNCGARMDMEVDHETD